MTLPFLNDLSQSVQRVPMFFQGINKNQLIADMELADGKNLDSEEIPALCPRKSIEKVAELKNPQFFKMINNRMCYIDGVDFYYDGIRRGEVTEGKKSVVDFNGYILIFPDKKYYNYIDIDFGEFDAPDIDYAVVHYNRVFGIKGNEIRASKLGDFREWEDFSGTELDSWAADVYSEGDFTGITTYSDHVVFFKRNRMYELYGYTPSQFRVIEACQLGCIDDRSIAEVGGVLYFMSDKGVQAYSGGFPQPRSQKLNIQNITSAVAIGDNRKYYLSFDGTTYIYDTWTKVWYPYLDKDVICFSKDDKAIYALASDGGIYRLESGNEQVKWEALTKLFDDGVFNKKYLKSVKLKLKMDRDAELKVYVNLDEKGFELVEHIINSEKYYNTHREILIDIPIKRATTYQIKFEGKGKSLVYGEKEFIAGSERP